MASNFRSLASPCDPSFRLTAYSCPHRLTGALSARFMLRLRACDVRKRLNPDLSFIDRAFPPLEQQSILDEFQSDIGIDEEDDLGGALTPRTLDTEGSVSSRRVSNTTIEEFVEGSSTGPATADPRKLKQRRQGMPPDLEEGPYSPRKLYSSCLPHIHPPYRICLL
jgi:hypothetical protein